MEFNAKLAFYLLSKQNTQKEKFLEQERYIYMFRNQLDLNIVTFNCDFNNGFQKQDIDYLLSFLVMDEPKNACYLCDDLRNIFQEEFWGKCNVFYTGSFVESMTNHSDFAMMHVADNFLVAEHPRDISDSFGDGTLLLEPELCSPGYTRLQLLRDIPGNTYGIYTSYNGTLYLDRMKYLNVKLDKHDMLNVDMHGPALLTFRNNGRCVSDMVECFECPVWPTFARKDFFMKKIVKSLNVNLLQVAVAILYRSLILANQTHT